VSHPTKELAGTEGSELAGKRIVLCVTGSVSAYRAPDIARELIRHGADVHAVLTQSATKIIHPYLMEWATGNPVVTELTGKIEHVLFTTGEGKADFILVAPATANTIGKIASGIDDTPVTSYISSALGAGIPIIVAPAMHDTMLGHPIIQENIEKLRKVGVVFIPPRMEEGKAKLPEASEILQAVIANLGVTDMKGLKVLVTGGPTVEPIDATRVVTNRSSGKMAVAVANAAATRGASVTLVLGPTAFAPQASVRAVRVRAAQEMYDAVMGELKNDRCDMVIAAAAVSDYAPQRISDGKIPSSRFKVLSLKMKRTPKIIEYVKEVSPQTFLIIFKAEHALGQRELVRRARVRMKETKADLAVVNDISRDDIGFGSDYNEVTIVEPSGKSTLLPRAPKASIAGQILSAALKNVRRR
jgi:phosphopantothenoylcysteine decarboxylase/phosphopantothenate--cysteine ligase